MPYIERDADGRIIGIFAQAQFEGQEFSETEVNLWQSYKHRRAPLYPPMQDRLDGMVKMSSSDPAIVAEGAAQVAAYDAACLAVKAQIPKD